MVELTFFCSFWDVYLALLSTRYYLGEYARPLHTPDMWGFGINYLASL